MFISPYYNCKKIVLILFFLLVNTGFILIPEVKSQTTSSSYELSDEIPQHIIDQRRNELIDAGLLFELELETLSRSNDRSLLEYISYTNTSFLPHTRSTRGIEFNPDGTRMYVVGRNTQNVIEYRLSTPWEIQTARYSREYDLTDTLSSESQDKVRAQGIYIRKQDGLKMWIVNRTEIWEFSLSTPWNVSTAHPTGFRNLTGTLLRGHDVDFRPDGTKMFMEDRFLGSVFQFRLSSPWDVSTAVLELVYNVPVQQDLQGIEFHPDGNRMFLIDNGLREIHEFVLSRPYDLSSISYLTSIPLEDTPDAIYMRFRPDFRQFFISDPHTARIHSYNIFTPPDAQLSTITALSSRVQANNESTSRIRVVALDSGGDPIEDLPVRLITKSGRLDYSPATAITNDTGEAYFEVKNNRVETVVYGAVSLDIELANTTSVRFLGVDPALSFIEVSENRIQANNNQDSNITILVHDEDNNPFPGLSVELIAQEGNPDIESVRSRTNTDGEAQFRISSRSPGSSQLIARTMGTTLSDNPVIEFLGADSDRSSLSLSSNRIQANQNGESFINVLVRDPDNNPFPNLSVELITQGGDPDIETLRSQTNSDGEALFRISSQTPGTTQIAAQVFGTTLTDNPDITFLGIDPAFSFNQQSDAYVLADGLEYATITVNARDEDNNPFTNVRMELFPDGGSSIIDPPSAITNEDGRAEFNISNQTSEFVSYQARGLGTTIDGSVTIGFIPVAPVVLAASDVETSSFTANWEAVPGTKQYQLDVATDSDFTSLLDSYSLYDAGSNTSAAIEGLSPGTDYFYRVRALQSSLIGEYSEPMLVTTRPDAPVALQASQANARVFRANWEVAQGARSYRLDVAEDEEFTQLVESYQDRQVGNVTHADVSGLMLGSTYYYRVRALAGDQFSDYSATIMATTLSISPENSIVQKQQLRTLANGEQTNEIRVELYSAQGVPLFDLPVELIANESFPVIDPVQPATDSEGVALFELLSEEAGKVRFRIQTKGIEIDTIEIEFLPDFGKLALGNNYPNPFSHTTTLPITVPKRMFIEIQIFDRIGRRVQTLINQELEAGYYEVPFYPEGLASGIYLFRLVTEEEILTERMVYIQ